jgi:RimJ/RimL family protein N-acetyltransferase
MILNRPNCVNFGITDPSSTTPDTLIGFVGVHTVPEVGYMIHPSKWGYGYATEALNGFLDFYFPYMKELGERAEFVEAVADPENAGSIKVLEKCGFWLKEKKVGDFEHWDKERFGMRDSLFYLYSPDGERQCY